MAVRDFKNNLRLTTIIILILFQLPGQFRYFYPGNRVHNEIDLTLKILFVLTLAVFLLLEFLEFKIWNYRYEKKQIQQVLFLIRLITALVLVFNRGDLGLSNPSFGLYYTLLIFYSYYIFPLPVSLSLCIGAVTFLLVYDFPRMFMGDEPVSIYRVFFSTYRILIMVVFYLFADFWNKDRDTSDKNIKLMEELNCSEQQLRDYANQVGHIVALEERNRLARDIHDSVGHALTGIQIQLSKAEAYFTLDFEESRRAILEARDAATGAMQDIRSSLGMLNDEDFNLSLKKEIPILLKGFESAGIKSELKIRGDEYGFNYAVLIALFRIVQEGITNILKHSRAKSVTLNLEFTEKEVILSIEDDGIGFNPDMSSYDRDNHFGLPGLKQRAELVRGIFQVKSSEGYGCILSAVLPKDPVSLIGESFE